VADTDGSGFIPADASLQVNEAGIGFPTSNLPPQPIPAGVHFQPIANNVDPSLSIPTSMQVVGGTVTVPVNIDDAHPEGSTGLIEAHLALTYDPSLFTVSAADVHLGSVLAAGSGWTIVSTINPVTGQIALALSSSTPIGSPIGGSLVTLDFHPTNAGMPSDVSRRVPGATAIELVASVNPSGQQVIATELEDAQGTFTLSPTPSFDPRMESLAIQDTIPEAGVVRIAATEGRPADEMAAETISPSLAAVTPASSDQDVVPTLSPISEATTGNHSASSAHAVVVSSFLAHTSAAPLSIGPIPGPFFPLGNTLALDAQSSAGAGAGRQVADQLFQALARGTSNPNYPPLVGTITDVFERFLVGQLLSPSAVDNQGSMIWFDVETNLDGPGKDGFTAMLRRRGHHDLTSNRTAPPVSMPHVDADRAALDWYLAQAAEEAAQTMDDE
jgi:hypothetical protein